MPQACLQAQRRFAHIVGDGDPGLRAGAAERSMDEQARAALGQPVVVDTAAPARAAAVFDEGGR